MYNGKRIGVVLPAYNEEENIKTAVKDFYGTGSVDEVIVVDNNSKDKTYQIAKRTRARVVKEKKQGYGYAIRRGLFEAYKYDCQIIFTVEPDNTFKALDVFKFLQYIDEHDVVLGTRTNKSTIKKGAKMGNFLRIGNIFVAKLLQLCHYKKTVITDVGCSFKCFNAKVLPILSKYYTTGDNSFSPDQMIACSKANLSVVEIPVTYRKRVGNSSITDTTWKSFKLGCKMIWLIIKRI